MGTLTTIKGGAGFLPPTDADEPPLLAMLFYARHPDGVEQASEAAAKKK